MFARFRFVFPVASILAFSIPAGTVLAGAHTWRVNELFSDSTGTIQYIELKECCGLPNETGVNGQTVFSTIRSYILSGPPIAGTSNKHLLIATPAFAALPGVPTPNYTVPAGSVPFFAIGGDTVTYSLANYSHITFGGAALPTDGVHSLHSDLTTPCNTPTNFAGATTTVRLGCSQVGDVDGNTKVNGDDIAGFIRVLLNAALPGDNIPCATYCTGAVATDVAAFVADLLS